jgi:mucin-19
MRFVSRVLPCIIPLLFSSCMGNLPASISTKVAATSMKFPSALVGTTASGQISLNWPDALESKGVIVVRSTGNAITFVPVSGKVYSLGPLDNTQTVAFIGSNNSFLDTTVTNGVSYSYAVFAFDSAYNYSVPILGTFLCGCDNLSAGQIFAGSGNSTSPYLLCTASQLSSISTNANLLSANFQLVADIDMSSFDGSTPEKTFNMIGNYDKSGATPAVSFTGTFDGNNHKILNLLISQGSSLAAGLFSNLGSGTVKNLTLVNVNVNGLNYVGSLAGYAVNPNVTNITVGGTVSGVPSSATTDGTVVGGLMGELTVSGSFVVSILSYLTVNVTVVGRDTVGGAFGYVNVTDSASLSVAQSSVSGSVSSSPQTAGNTFGGFVSYLVASSGSTVTFSNDSASGNVSSTGSWVGGFAGSVGTGSPGATMVITGCTSSGTVSTTGTSSPVLNGNSGGMGIGGFIGNSTPSAGSVTIAMCSSESNVVQSSTVSAFGIGGFMGYASIASPGGTSAIQACSSSGNVTVSSSSVSKVGGFIGLTSGANSFFPSIANSYSMASVNAPNSTYVGGFAGMNSASISDSFEAGTISGASSDIQNVGGFIGVNSGTLSNSYWDSSLMAAGLGTSSSVTTGASGLTTSQFQSANSFSGWDFTNTWFPPTAESFPTLR